MRIDGQWAPARDGEIRPVIRGIIRAQSGEFVEVPFLVDTGADRTVLSADIFRILGLKTTTPFERVEGVGGRVESVHVETVIWLFHSERGLASFPGRYSALTDPASLDMSVLGRDIMQNFALIVDQPGGTICLVNQRHGYTIVTH